MNNIFNKKEDTSDDKNELSNKNDVNDSDELINEEYELNREYENSDELDYDDDHTNSDDYKAYREEIAYLKDNDDSDYIEDGLDYHSNENKTENFIYPDDSSKDFKNNSSPNICIVKKIRGVFNGTESFKLTKSKILSIFSFILGLILVILGIIMISGASTKVVDNVAFSEATIMAAFLIILGLFFLVLSVLSTIIKKTPLEGIYTEVKSVERNMDINVDTDGSVDKYASNGSDAKPYDLNNSSFSDDNLNNPYYSDNVDFHEDLGDSNNIVEDDLEDSTYSNEENSFDNEYLDESNDTEELEINNQKEEK